MKILFIGDIVSKPGKEMVQQILPDLKMQESIDLVVANGENLTQGRGVSASDVQDLVDAGVDYFTSGDHVFWQKNTDDYIESLPMVIPANYPSKVPGKRFAIVKDTLIINIMGRVSFGGTFSYLEDPFTTVDQIILENKTDQIKNIIVDFHAEATSEKAALGFYLDGRVSAVLGTHTHVPTCDQRTLPNGTLFCTDVGMTGIIDSVLGVKTEIILESFLSARNQRFEWESTGLKAFRSVILDLENRTITRFDKVLE